jgi:hypothetical protein
LFELFEESIVLCDSAEPDLLLTGVVSRHLAEVSCPAHETDGSEAGAEQ